MGVVTDLIAARARPLSSPLSVVPGPTEVTWDGLNLSERRPDGIQLAVTGFAGWYGLPEPNVGDVARALVDGMVPGPKVIGARNMTLQGTIFGRRAPTRAALVRLIDDLVARAASKEPLVISAYDPVLDQTRQAEVRAVGRLEQTWSGPLSWTYSVALRATDPRLYSSVLQSAVLYRGTGETGRLYPRTYPWQYRSPITTTGAILANEGNTDAPVLITYTGDFSASRLTDGRSGSINLEPLPAGMRLFVNSATLAIWAPGGYSRARYLQAGSRPLTLAPHSSTRWNLYVGEGHGNVRLDWRSAWL